MTRLRLPSFTGASAVVTRLRIPSYTGEPSTADYASALPPGLARLVKRDPHAAAALARMLLAAAKSEERGRLVGGGTKRECPTCGKLCNVLKGGSLWGHHLPPKFLATLGSLRYDDPGRFNSGCPGVYDEGSDYVVRLRAAIAAWRAGK